jgi:hypothetical protein
MRLAPLLLMLTSILISGCASQSVDCTMGAGHNGCTPGTKEYEQMVHLQQDAKSTAEIDDAVCRSFGAEPGSTAYAECRRKRTGDRQLFEPPRTPQTRPLSDSK